MAGDNLVSLALFVVEEIGLFPTTTLIATLGELYSLNPVVASDILSTFTDAGRVFWAYKKMDDELLIELVRNYPVLYDLAQPKYMDSNFKKDIWNNIGEEMKIDGK